MNIRKALNGTIVIECIDIIGASSPVAIESVKECLRDDVEKRQDHQFVDEGEEEHRMRECCRQAILCQTQTILEYQHNSTNAKRHTDQNYRSG